MVSVEKLQQVLISASSPTKPRRALLSAPTSDVMTETGAGRDGERKSKRKEEKEKRREGKKEEKWEASFVCL